ncbi:MAG: hypothetical protein HQL28_03390 [Candidatus Omnitrophica bacterium]|nr:hypothetical protein [Candidatus Omnitrophota bacterium]
MIAQIRGKIIDKTENAFIVETSGIAYEILLPGAIFKALDGGHPVGSEISLVIYHYFQMSPSSGVPVLIGFENAIEKEFFEKFISVSGIGPKAASRALVEPLSLVASAIDAGDAGYLKKLPGIGTRKAAEVIAKLQGKVGKYGLIRDNKVTPAIDDKKDVKAEAMAVLAQLQYNRTEAENMVKKAMERNPELKTSEELLNEVYRGSRK